MTTVVLSAAAAVIVSASPSTAIVSPHRSDVVVSSAPTSAIVQTQKPSVVVNSGARGPQGPQGEPGQSGSGSTTFPIINLTGSTLGGHRLVTIDPVTGGAIYADCTSAAHADAPIGLTTSALANGATGTAQQVGPVTEPSWSWVTGTPLYVGTNGMPVSYSDLPAVRAFDRVVGRTTAATAILLCDEQPIVK